MHTATKLVSKGCLQFGTQTFNTGILAANTSYLVGNPYASAVNFDKVYANSVNIARKFWTYDASLSTTGAYVTCIWNGSSYVRTPVTGTNQDQYIQNGQAFFVQTINAGNAQITFNEAAKTNTSTTTVLGSGNNEIDMLGINLNRVESDSTHTLVDGVLAMYQNNYSIALDNEDAVKIPNIFEGLGIKSNNRILAIEGKPFLIGKDTLLLKTTNLKLSKYKIDFIPTGFDGTVTACSLFDKYLNTIYTINTTTNST